jgi:urease accessory protein
MRWAVVIIMAKMTTIIMGRVGLSRLLVAASPAFPTGGFAYSHGLEWAVEAGDVRDEKSLRGWLDVLLCEGAGWSDAVLLRHGFRSAGDEAAVSGLAEMGAALAPCLERRMETLAQGEAFAASAAAWGAVAPAAYPVVFGVFAARQGIDEESACLGFLSSWLGNLVSAGVRLVPLGQQAGLRVLHGLEASVLGVVAESACATLDDLGTSCFRADIAAMRHETQYSRMFRS